MKTRVNKPLGIKVQYITSKMMVVGFTMSMMTGCSALSSFTNIFHSDSKIKQPTELVEIESSVSLLQPVFTKDLGSARGYKKDPLHLRSVFDGHYIFTALRNGKVVSYNLNEEKLWESDIKEDITGGVAYDYMTKTLIVSSRSGKVYALDSQSGRTKWKHQLTGTVLSPAAISSNANRVLLSANDGFLYGLDLQSGQVIWKFSTQVPKLSIRGTAKPIILGDNALFSTADGRVYAMDLISGSPEWSNRIGVASGLNDVSRLKDVDGSPVINNGFLYATSYSGQLLGINLKNRKVAFFKQIASLHKPLITSELVVVTSIDGEVVAFDKQTGELKWQNNTLLNRQLTNPVEVSRYIAVGDYEGVIHLLDMTSGKIVSREKITGALNHLQVFGNKLITQSIESNVAVWQW